MTEMLKMCHLLWLVTSFVVVVVFMHISAGYHLLLPTELLL